ncbi:MAG: hypothetical protein AAFN70_09300, partial [Planctomycetota bacterium]
FDINNDQDFDTAPTDRPLSGVDVTLNVDLDGDGSTDYTTTVITGSDGKFEFNNLLPGTYSISTDRNDMPAGLANNPSVDNDGIGSGSQHVATYAVTAGNETNGTGFGFHATPDYEIEKTTTSGNVSPGDTIQYTIRVKNNGELDGRNVVITDTFPTALMQITDAGGGTVDASAGTIKWTIASLDSGQQRLYTVQARLINPSPSGFNEVVNTATVDDDQYNGVDPDKSDNTSTVRTPYNNALPDYDISVTDNLEEADAGDPIRYEIVVKNIGNQNGTGIVVTSKIKPQLMTNIVPSNGGTYDPNTGIITWNLSSLNGGDSVVLYVDGNVIDPLTYGEPHLCNTVNVSDDGSNGTDPDLTNNTATDETDIPAFGFDSFTDLSGGDKDIAAYNAQVTGQNSDHVGQRLGPLNVDTVYSGIVDPGTTLNGKIYDQHGRMIGEQIVVADSAGNWLMQFPTLVLHEQPHDMKIKQTLAVQNQHQYGGFNLRRFFHPAVHNQLYMTNMINVSSAWQNQTSVIVTAMHAANNDPLGFDWKHHAYELVVASSNTAAR